MANEIQIQTGFGAGTTLYAIIRNSVSQVYNTSTQLFETYSSGNYANYFTAMSEQGTISGFFAGNFPTAITSGGVYSVSILRQSGGSPAEGDPTVGGGDLQWSGSVTIPLSSLASSGQVSSFAPLKIYRGESIPNFPFYLVSSADHVTPLVSGICSGQISRDGGAFTNLQSGIMSEVGFGIYTTTLTSGDMLCNSASLRFTGAGVSGGSSDARLFTLLTQRTSLSGSF